MLDAHPGADDPARDPLRPGPDRRRGRARGRRRESALEAIVTAKQRGWGEFGLAEADMLERAWRARPLDAAGALRAFYELYAERQGKPR